MRRVIRPSMLVAAVLGSGLVSGCGTAVSNGRSTALAGDDLQRITSDMAQKIAADPEVAAAIGREGALPTVVLPVENQMTGEILPRGQAAAFTTRLRTLLSQQMPGKFVFVLNRDDFYMLRNAELDKGPAPESIQPRYALHARFQTLTKDSRDRRSVYYLCVYEITDISNRVSLWTGSYEMKKAVVKGFLD